MGTQLASPKAAGFYWFPDSSLYRFGSALGTYTYILPLVWDFLKEGIASGTFGYCEWHPSTVILPKGRGGREEAGGRQGGRQGEARGAGGGEAEGGDEGEARGEAKRRQGGMRGGEAEGRQGWRGGGGEAGGRQGLVMPTGALAETSLPTSAPPEPPLAQEPSAGGRLGGGMCSGFWPSAYPGVFYLWEQLSPNLPDATWG